MTTRGYLALGAIVIALGTILASVHSLTGPPPNHYREPTPLMRAAERGDIPTLRRLLANGENPNQVHDEVGGWHRTPTQNKSPLMFAAERGQLTAAQLLVDAGADLYAETNTDGAIAYYVPATAFSYAIDSGKTDLVRYLWSISDKVSFRRDLPRVIAQAVSRYMADQQFPQGATRGKDYPGTIKYLLTEIASPEESSAALFQFADSGHLEAIEYIVKHGGMARADSLWQAARTCRMDIAKLLLAAGANANGQYGDQSPLMGAREGNCLDTVGQLLIAHGADPKALEQTRLPRAFGTPLQTPLGQIFRPELELITGVTRPLPAGCALARDTLLPGNRDNVNPWASADRILITATLSALLPTDIDWKQLRKLVGDSLVTLGAYYTAEKSTEQGNIVLEGIVFRDESKAQTFVALLGKLRGSAMSKSVIRQGRTVLFVSFMAHDPVAKECRDAITSSLTEASKRS